jgi:GPH family glycoside/pentoside/hexuronide:cation symporter
MFYSLVTLFAKGANSLAIPLALLVLDWSGYIPNAASQPQSTLTGIRLVVGPIPAFLLLCGIMFAIFFPLTREAHQKVVSELEIRREDLS